MPKIRISRNHWFSFTLEALHLDFVGFTFILAATPTTHVTLQQYEHPMVIDSTTTHQINQALAYINGLGPTLGPFEHFKSRMSIGDDPKMFLNRLRYSKLQFNWTYWYKCCSEHAKEGFDAMQSLIFISFLSSHTTVMLISCLESQIRRLLQHFTHLHQNYYTITNHWYTQTGKCFVCCCRLQLIEDLSCDLPVKVEPGVVGVQSEQPNPPRIYTLEKLDGQVTLKPLTTVTIIKQET